MSILRDAQRQLAIGRAPAVVIALVAEHEPALAAELAAITEGENGRAGE